MNVSEYMKKHGITDEALGAAAAKYEAGDYQSESGTVYSGSHIDAVGKKRVTVVYGADDAQSAEEPAEGPGA